MLMITTKQIFQKAFEPLSMPLKNSMAYDNILLRILKLFQELVILYNCSTSAWYFVGAYMAIGLSSFTKCVDSVHY